MNKLFVFVLIALSGCASGVSRHNGPERAVAMQEFLRTCDNRGGVVYFREANRGPTWIYCADGHKTTFTFQPKERK